MDKIITKTNQSNIEEEINEESYDLKTETNLFGPSIEK